VAFFSSCEDAELAGFRACKRCKPKDSSAFGLDAEAVMRVCRLIEAAEEPPALKDLAATVGLSQFHFHRLFKQVVGVTPKEYSAAQRMRRLQDGLHQGASVTQAIYDAGFGSSSRFYESAVDMLGMTPSKYKNGADGLEIRFAIAQSFLGWVLVAATEQGICAIDFGETSQVLAQQLRVRFPKAQLRDNDPTFATWIAQVTAFIEAPRRGLDLPLDIQGTAFQRRVWKALQEIPPGKTESYTEVAERIGSPTAARAVARACASNTIAIAIPCHRVVRSNGDLSGYRWGIERKRALLAREAENPHAPDEAKSEGRSE
jgi:AraC family transcriptional regulator of adaptative response/methylated-DNA-[protein]-cysteine methyltransferase